MGGRALSRGLHRLDHRTAWRRNGDLRGDEERQPVLYRDLSSGTDIDSIFLPFVYLVDSACGVSGSMGRHHPCSGDQDISEEDTLYTRYDHSRMRVDPEHLYTLVLRWSRSGDTSAGAGRSPSDGAGIHVHAASTGTFDRTEISGAARDDAREYQADQIPPRELMTKSCSNAIIVVRFSTYRAFLRHNPEVQGSIGREGLS